MKSKVLTIVIGGMILFLGVYYFYPYSQHDVEQIASNNEIKLTQKQDLPDTHAEKVSTDSTLAAADQQGESVATTVQTLEAQDNQARFSNEADIQNLGAEVIEVEYDGGKFTPSSVELKVGDIVFFANKSKISFWPASAPHPSHSAYPEFDAKKSFGPGDTFEFKFTKVGSWKYHDHLNPSATGVVNVSK